MRLLFWMRLGGRTHGSAPTGCGVGFSNPTTLNQTWRNRQACSLRERSGNRTAWVGGAWPRPYNSWLLFRDVNTNAKHPHPRGPGPQPRRGKGGGESRGHRGTGAGSPCPLALAERAEDAEPYKGKDYRQSQFVPVRQQQRVTRGRGMPRPYRRRGYVLQRQLAGGHTGPPLQSEAAFVPSNRRGRRSVHGCAAGVTGDAIPPYIFCAICLSARRISSSAVSA